jgi:hypothetical protein
MIGQSAMGSTVIHEGFDTRDLKEAKALLEELGSNGKASEPFSQHRD